MFTRRFFLGSTLLAAAMSCSREAGAQQVLEPEAFGARGDGRADDTAAIQRCINAAGPGAVVRLRAGRTYRIDTNVRPTFQRFGGLQMANGMVLDLNGATLAAIPTEIGQGAVVQAHETDGWRIVGPGRIIGERAAHRGRDGEWGMGIAVFGGRGWRIEGGVSIRDCWGDGLYLSSQGQSGRFCEDFVIDGLVVDNCRRNGISVIAARRGEIRAPQISNIKGAPPQAGIDFEPDDPRFANSSIRVTGGTIRGVEVGIGLVVANRDITIEGMQIAAHNSGIIIGDGAQRVRIRGNPRVQSLRGGQEGGAIRVVASDAATIRAIDISGNGLFGGGFYVLDMYLEGMRDFVVRSNRLHASNPGTHGIARAWGITFIDNVATVEAAAGHDGGFIVHFQRVRESGNSIRNNSRRSLRPLVLP